MDLIECMHTRRSIRAYKTDPVSRTVIDEILWATVQAPTPPVSGNEAWALCVIDGRDRLEAYGERARRYAFEHQPADQPWEWTVRLLPCGAEPAARDAREGLGHLLGRRADAVAV